MPKPQRGSSLGAIVPQEITHEKVLKHCDEESTTSLPTVETLGEKLAKHTAVVTLA